MLYCIKLRLRSEEESDLIGGERGVCVRRNTQKRLDGTSLIDDKIEVRLLYKEHKTNDKRCKME